MSADNDNVEMFSRYNSCHVQYLSLASLYARYTQSTSEDDCYVSKATLDIFCDKSAIYTNFTHMRAMWIEKSSFIFHSSR